MASKHSREVGDQFVSVASIVKELLPKVAALRKGLEDDWGLMLKHFAMVHPPGTTIPGGMYLADAMMFLTKAEEDLRSVREVDPQ